MQFRKASELTINPHSTHPRPYHVLDGGRCWRPCRAERRRSWHPGCPWSKIHHVITDLDNYWAGTEQGTVTEGARVVRETSVGGASRKWHSELLLIGFRASCQRRKPRT